MSLDPMTLADLGTSAGSGGAVAAIIAWANKFFLDRKIEKICDELEQQRLHLAENFFKKADIMEIVKEMKAENAANNAILTKKLDQLGDRLVTELTNIKVALAERK